MERLADRYELGDTLGQGRSTVFRALDTRLRRDVAIKRVQLVAGQEDAEQVRRRALLEAQASARLNDPASVAVYDVVEEAGAIWLVMELVDGRSLAAVVADEGPLPHRRAARLGLGVLTALDAAHRAGVVHRDVKPANVLVTDRDRVKLTDFGVATIRDESRVTATGLIVGSPSYMAPEQATGGEITPATDMWALGATLYFAVEGEPPFQAGSALATASAVVHGEPRPPQHPGPLSPLVARLLVKDPAGRPSAAEIRAALTRVARGRRRAAAPTAPVPAASADDTAVHPRPGTLVPGPPDPTAPDPTAPGSAAPGAPVPGPPAPDSTAPDRATPGAPGAPDAPGVPAPGPPAPDSTAPDRATPGAPGAPDAPGVPAPGPPAPGSTAPGPPAPAGPPSGSPAVGEPAPTGPVSRAQTVGESRPEPTPGPPAPEHPGAGDDGSGQVARDAAPAAAAAVAGDAGPETPAAGVPAVPAGGGVATEPTAADSAGSGSSMSGGAAAEAAVGGAAPGATAPRAAARPETPAGGDPGSGSPVADDPGPAQPGGAVPDAPALGGPGAPAWRRLPPAVIAGAIGVVVLLVVVAVAMLGDDGDGDGGSAGGPEPSTTAPASETEPDDGDPADGTTTEPETTTTTEPSGLPDGWSQHTDPSGAYSIGLPPGWQVRPTGSASRVDLVDPASGSFLRVEWTDSPGPSAEQAWRDLAPSVARNNPGYQEIGIDPVAYRDYDAALWEFRHGAGPVWHTGNLGFVADGKGFALMLRTPESLWQDSQPLFEQFKETFRPSP